MEETSCRACGERSSPEARFCSRCGQPLDPPAVGRVFLGDYEIMAYDNEPIPPSIDWDNEDIIDRDQLPALRPVRSAARRWSIHLILMALLVILGVAAYGGVQALSARREAKAAEEVRQAQLRKEAEERALREAYLRNWSELIILAQAQSKAYAWHLDELRRIEDSRWLTKIFLGGIYESRIQKFQASDEMASLGRRQTDIENRLSALADPPKDLDDLLEHAQALSARSEGVYDLLIDEIAEETAAEIADALATYDDVLAKAVIAGP